MSDDQISAKDLLDVLADAGLLATFSQVPQEDQDEFSSWIGKARNDENWRRIEALVLAMKSGSLKPEARGSRKMGLA